MGKKPLYRGHKMWPLGKKECSRHPGLHPGLASRESIPQRTRQKSKRSRSAGNWHAGLLPRPGPACLQWAEQATERAGLGRPARGGLGAGLGR